MKKVQLLMLCLVSIISCKKEEKHPQVDDVIQEKLDQYVSVKLTTDLTSLTERQKQLIPLFVEAAEQMNDLFWYEAYGDKSELLKKVEREELRDFIEINYGPWDRLGNNEPFLPQIEKKPLGANFYPKDMGKEEFEAFEDSAKTSLYTFVRRDKEGKLYTIPYHEQFEREVKKVSDILLKAAELSEDEGLKKYLELRAKAFLNDDYQESDMAWMDMKSNTLDLVIGPIETYEDQLYGTKAAHEAYVLVKDMEWSKQLEKFSAFLPELQKGLPVADIFKQEAPGTDSDLNAYEVIYYAGDCNAGSKTIAINLPNDEQVQLQKGTRRLQLKNAMRAKFEKILVPIADVLIDESQRKHITFDAFFANTMFHEVAHGLGIKNTINGKGTVRSALKEHASALEEGKADVLGLYMVEQLYQKGELAQDVKDNMVTFMAGIFRSVRFGASSAHGKANMIRFNYFKEEGAFVKTEEETYRVDFDKMHLAMEKLSRLILELQGEGNYEGVAQLVKEKGLISEALQADLNRLSEAEIPVDIVFEQGLQVLGL